MITLQQNECVMALTEPDKHILLTRRFDGCTHIETWANGETFDTPSPKYRDYLHVCDLDEFIAQLQELKRLSDEHFKQSTKV